MRCKKCKQKVLQKSGGIVKVRINGPLIFGKDGVARAKCYWCKEEVELPLAILQGTEMEEERFFLKPQSAPTHQP